MTDNQIIDQEVDFSIVGADERTEADQKIADIAKIIREEGLENDPDIVQAFHEAIKESLQQK
jgi:uncharacterized lipoprotein YajG